MNLRIKSVRKHYNKTQREFGETLGVSRDTFASYESGRVAPSKTFVQLLCSTYHVSEDWLTSGMGKMFVESKETSLDGLCSRFDMSYYARKVVECYLNLEKEQRDGLEVFFDRLIKACNAGITDERAVDKAIHMLSQNIADESTNTSSALSVEEEADRFAEMARKQFLSEKIRESQISSVKESGAG